MFRSANFALGLALLLPSFALLACGPSRGREPVAGTPVAAPAAKATAPTLALAMVTGRAHLQLRRLALGGDPVDGVRLLGPGALHVVTKRGVVLVDPQGDAAGRYVPLVPQAVEAWDGASFGVLTEDDKHVVFVVHQNDSVRFERVDLSVAASREEKPGTVQGAAFVRPLRMAKNPEHVWGAPQVSPSGRFLVFSRPGQRVAFDTSSGRQVFALADTTWATADTTFLSDTELLLPAESSLRVLDMLTGRVVRERRIEQDSPWTLVPDPHRVVVLRGDKTLELWSPLTNATSTVAALDSPCAGCVVSTIAPNRVRLSDETLRRDELIVDLEKGAVVKRAYAPLEQTLRYGFTVSHASDEGGRFTGSSIRTPGGATVTLADRVTAMQVTEHALVVSGPRGWRLVTRSGDIVTFEDVATSR